MLFGLKRPFASLGGCADLPKRELQDTARNGQTVYLFGARVSLGDPLSRRM